MNDAPEKSVADIVAATGGRLVSRVRLQKLAYLLDQIGGKSGFHYVYHYYGPYSRDLDTAILDAEADGLVTERIEHRQRDGAHYSIFQARFDTDQHPFCYLESEALRERAKRLASEHVTVLELAATAHWLKQVEKVEDWRSEIVRRKGTKTSDGRLDEAMRLLTELGLPPATAPA
jgi:uncharacterized protein YwgA